MVRLVLADHVIDLIESHVDIAVRIGQLPDSDLVARRVGQIQWIICASPGYLGRRGEPASPTDLLEHDCIAFEGLQTYRSWTFGAGSSPYPAPIRPKFSVNTADAVIDAAIAGVGIARVMSYQAAAAIRSESLLAILKAHAPAPTPVHLVHRSQRAQPLKQRAFLDFVTPRLKIALEEVDNLYH
jgi:DNA-binding transcriptional LysR family regulator